MTSTVARIHRIPRWLVGGLLVGTLDLTIVYACVWMHSNSNERASIGISDILAVALLWPGIVPLTLTGIDGGTVLGKILVNATSFVFFGFFGALWSAGHRGLSLVIGIPLLLCLWATLLWRLGDAFVGAALRGP
jgi:hypothetical protein